MRPNSSNYALQSSVCPYRIVWWPKVLCTYFVDSHWILLCADGQDFIPLTFTAAQTVMVRDGSLSKPEEARGSLSHNQDPDPSPEVLGNLATQNVDAAVCSNSVT